MEISRIGINVEDSILYIEYCPEENGLTCVRKVELTQELLSPNNVCKLVEYLKENKSDIFNDNVDILESKFQRLLLSIAEYKREKILKSGADLEKEIEEEENKMNKPLEKNVINSSFESEQNEEILNDWEEEIDEDIEILDESTNDVDNQFLENIVADFIENQDTINNEPVQIK
eukprot:UN00135